MRIEIKLSFNLTSLTPYYISGLSDEVNKKILQYSGSYIEYRWNYYCHYCCCKPGIVVEKVYD